jgi:DNA polymerase III subunit delta'
MIFAGPSGIGKTSMAYRVARFLLKHGGEMSDQGGLFGDAPEPLTTMDVSPNDPVFHRVASGGHPDLRTIERAADKKTAVVDIDSVRKIAPFLRMRSSEGGWRVVIVDDADLMNKYAQNAILKILEEPPEKALLILIVSRLGAMIPTIRSRCRVFHFAPLADEIMKPLVRRAVPSLSDSDAALLSLLAGGSVGRALSLHEDGGINTLRIILGFLEEWPAWSWTKLHPWADNLSRAGEEKSYAGFCALMEWVCASLTRAKAVGAGSLPEILKTEALERLMGHYSLEQWSDICEKMKEHFQNIEHSNLDKRQGVLGAFALLGGQG